MFNLQFISKPYWSTERNELVIRGCITLGDFSEEFESSLSFWSQADYEQHWLEATSRIETGQTKSVFIVDMYDPSKTPFILWWPIWQTDQTILVHNQLLLFKNLTQAFDPTNPYIHIGDHTTKNENGEANLRMAGKLERHKRFCEIVRSKDRLTMAGTGAAQASFLCFGQCYVRGPVTPGVRRPGR